MAFKISEISPDYEAWISLQASSPYSSPFQSPEYYEFLKTQPNHVAVVVSVSGELSSSLLALVVVDIQSNGNSFLRPFTSRAIVQAGPLISPDCPQEAFKLLMAKTIELSNHNSAVYFEIRSYFDYSRYANLFSSCGMNFIDYGDCIADTTSLAAIDRNIQPRKMTQIRSALRKGTVFVDTPSDAQITEFYALLKRKHWQRTRRPIPPLQYFLDLAHTSIAAVLLAYNQGNLISGCVVVRPAASSLSSVQPAYYYYVAGENDLFRQYAPSSVITYHFLQYACSIGCQHASLMGSGRLSVPFGVRDFKVKMGGRIIPSGRYLFLIHPFIYKLASFALNLLHRSDT